MSSFYTSSPTTLTFATFVPTSSSVIIQTIRRPQAPQNIGGKEWWSGNRNTTSAKVDLVMTMINTNLISVTENGVSVGTFRQLGFGVSNLGVLIRDYRGLARDIKAQGEHTIRNTALINQNNPRDVYHERFRTAPGYDLIRTDYEQKGWINGRVYYYGVRAEVVPDLRYAPDSMELHWHAPITVSVSHTPSALTPKRAVRVESHENEIFRLPYGDIIEFVEQGKVVMTITQRHYDTETKRQFEEKWCDEVRRASIMVTKLWKKTTTSIPTTDRFERETEPTYRIYDGVVLLTDISSKNIVDTPMNPFGEGTIAKNRISLGDGLFYITDTPDVPQFAIEKAKRNYLFKKELMEAVLHPDRVAKMVEKYGIDWVDV